MVIVKLGQSRFKLAGVAMADSTGKAGSDARSWQWHVQHCYVSTSKYVTAVPDILSS
jgi:hypothetical protein